MPAISAAAGTALCRFTWRGRRTGARLCPPYELGKGDASKLSPVNPRFAFDEVCKFSA